MSNDKSQLNIKIDPRLLLKLKSKAIKSGKTLTAFVTELIEQDSTRVIDDFDLLEKRLLRLEERLNISDNFSSEEEEKVDQSESIFSDNGAKIYGEIARELFELSGIKGVFIGKDFVTITKSESVEWESLKPSILSSLQDILSSGIKTDLGQASKNTNTTKIKYSKKD